MTEVSKIFFDGETERWVYTVPNHIPATLTLVSFAVDDRELAEISWQLMCDGKKDEAMSVAGAQVATISERDI